MVCVETVIAIAWVAEPISQVCCDHDTEQTREHIRTMRFGSVWPRIVSLLMGICRARDLMFLRRTLGL